MEAIGSLELCMCLLPTGKSIQLPPVGLRGTAAIPRRFVGWAFIRLLLAIITPSDRPAEQKHTKHGADTKQYGKVDAGV
jgi:hypothetical protein